MILSMSNKLIINFHLAGRSGKSGENNFPANVKIETPNEEDRKSFKKTCDIFIDPNCVQVQANSEELNRRIQAFISRKREHVNLLNIQEFCFHG